MSDLARTVLDRLIAVFEAARDPKQAPSMAAYMKHQFPFLGIKSPAQNKLAREVLAGLPTPNEANLRAVALGCWALPEREYQYFACAYLRRHIRHCGPGFMDTARRLIVEKSWWDTVDALAARTVGPLVSKHPSLVAVMDRWSSDPNLWLVRTAILHQLTFKEATDAKRLFHYCATQAGHRNFFVRKAIGWALREYAKTDPTTVRAFVSKHSAQLSALSVREALKNIS